MSDRRKRFRKLWAAILPCPTLSKDVLRLATPVTLGMLTFTLLSIVDTAMLGRLGAVPLAAAGVAGVLYFAVVFPISSMSVGTQSLVARRFGEGNEAQCGQILNTGLVLCFAFGIPLVIAAPWLARVIAPLSSNDPQVIEAGAVYLQYRLLGSPFMLLNFVSSGFFAGIGKTKHQLVGSIFITATNILLDYLLIFGNAGFPKLGIQGAAIASSIALGVGTVYYMTVLVLPKYKARYSTFRRPWFASQWLRPMVRLSSPILAQRILSNGAWAVFFAIIARIGTIELAATNVIRSIYHLSIMIAVGFGTAAAALIGQNLGAKNPEKAEQMAWESVKLTTYAMIIIGILFLTVPGFVFRIYTAEASVIGAGRLSLMLLGFVQAFAGVALVLSLSLQGAGNTRYVMVVEFICVLLYLPTVYVLGLRTSLGLVGAWTGEYVYWIVLAIAMVWKFRTGSWKTIKL
ncbi:MAG: MATE family efflux transporter [Lentisphaerae bacterium]|nr:MATE family efflux transporter [Lentisphaerota bacterium]